MVYSGVHPSVRAQPPHILTQYAIPNSISFARSSGRSGTTFAGCSAIKACKRTPRGHGSLTTFGRGGVRAVQGSKGILNESFRATYSPVCMRTMASLTSCSANQVSRVAATAASYWAPRFRIPCPLLRCASTSRRRNLHRASKAFRSLMANSRRLENLSHPSTEGSGISAGRSSTGSTIMNSYCDAPRRLGFMKGHKGHSRNRRIVFVVPLNDEFPSTFEAAVRPLNEQRRHTSRASTPRCAASCRLNSGPNPVGDRGRERFALTALAATPFATGAR